MVLENPNTPFSPQDLESGLLSGTRFGVAWRESNVATGCSQVCIQVSPDKIYERHSHGCEDNDRSIVALCMPIAWLRRRQLGLWYYGDAMRYDSRKFQTCRNTNCPFDSTYTNSYQCLLMCEDLQRRSSQISLWLRELIFCESNPISVESIVAIVYASLRRIP